VVFSMISGPDSPRVEVPSPVLRQKLRLARRLANLVVVIVHWGSELLEWPNADQRRAADWLIRHGVDVIIGHHPHVFNPLNVSRGKRFFTRWVITSSTKNTLPARGASWPIVALPVENSAAG